MTAMLGPADLREALSARGYRPALGALEAELRARLTAEFGNDARAEASSRAAFEGPANSAGVAVPSGRVQGGAAAPLAAAGLLDAPHSAANATAAGSVLAAHSAQALPPAPSPAGAGWAQSQAPVPSTAPAGWMQLGSASDGGFGTNSSFGANGFGGSMAGAPQPAQGATGFGDGGFGGGGGGFGGGGMDGGFAGGGAAMGGGGFGGFGAGGFGGPTGAVALPFCTPSAGSAPVPRTPPRPPAMGSGGLTLPMGTASSPQASAGAGMAAMGGGRSPINNARSMVSATASPVPAKGPPNGGKASDPFSEFGKLPAVGPFTRPGNSAGPAPPGSGAGQGSR